MSEHKFYTVTEAAQAMGLSVSHARRYFTSGLLKSEKKGGVWLVDSQEVEQFIKRKKELENATKLPRNS